MSLPCETLTRRDLAAVLGVTPDTVSAWGREDPPVPCLAPGGRGRPSAYKLRDVLRWYVDREAKLRGGGERLDERYERARWYRANRLRVEQATAREARHLVPAEEVRRHWAGAAAAVKNVLQSWPPRAAGALAARAWSVEALMDRLEELTDEVLDEMSRAAGDGVPPDPDELHPIPPPNPVGSEPDESAD